MILYLEYLSGSRQRWTIRSFADLQPIAMQYPQINAIAARSSDLKEAVGSIAEYLDSGPMDSWVEDDGDFSKSIKQALTGIGVAAALSLSPQSIAQEPSMAPMHHETKTLRASPLGQEPEDLFLGNIMQLESSGGKNTNHPKIKYGIAKGDRAIGRWGMLKPTIDETISRMEQAKTMPPEVEKMKGMSRDGMDAYIKHNPSVELYLARHLARHVLHRQHHDSRRAAYAWLHGHNLTPADISEHDLSNEKYVRDYVNLSKPKRLIQKAEKHVGFKDRLQAWKTSREIQSQQDNQAFPERNRGVDPGRLIDPSEEIDLRTKTGDPKQDLENAIEEAKRARFKP